MSISEDLTTRVLSRRIHGALTVQDSLDLLLLIGLALLLPLVMLLPFPVVRLPIALIALLLAPGYALVAALFPQRADLDGVGRAAASFGLSIAILPLLALLLSALPWGIRPWPAAIVISVWLLVLGLVGLWRRWVLAPANTAFLPPVVELPGLWQRWREGRQFRYVVGGTVLVGVLILGTLAAFVYDPATRLTEFYILGNEGLVQDYPREATRAEELTVMLGIANGEGTDRVYRMEVWIIDGSDPARQIQVVQAEPRSLKAGEKVEWPVRWHMPWTGDNQKVEFRLFEGNNPQPYRLLRLWLNVVEHPT